MWRVLSRFGRPHVLGAAAAAAGAGAVGLIALADPTTSQPCTTNLLHLLTGGFTSAAEAKAADAAPAFIVVSPTFYGNKDDPRFALGIEACRRAKTQGIPLLLVDASPPEIRKALEEAGAEVCVQTRAGRKGAALREAIGLARARLPSDGVICFQELEKVEMIALQREVAHYVASSGCDVCVPRREDCLFRRSYPVEQYHSEQFANLYLDALGSLIGLPSLDWTFGPVALRASAATFWEECDGELWDAQIVPFIRAAMWGSARVEALQVHYTHPAAMKREEEFVPIWSEKRLLQLNFLFKHVAGALKETAPPS